MPSAEQFLLRSAMDCPDACLTSTRL